MYGITARAWNVAALLLTTEDGRRAGGSSRCSFDLVLGPNFVDLLYRNDFDYQVVMAGIVALKRSPLSPPSRILPPTRAIRTLGRYRQGPN